MYCELNLQHLGRRHPALSNLTWFESLLIARVHPVVSVVTLTATGQLCYAGHICNYYMKTLEWFNSLPAKLRHKCWFMIKRRRSINASATDTRRKKPTTCNRLRLEAGFACAIEHMPNVYRDSYVSVVELAKYPKDCEVEMLEQEESIDLDGEVHLDRDMFAAWLKTDAPCASVLLQYARISLSDELRGDNSPDSIWDLICRDLGRPCDDKPLGSRELAQSIVFWLDEAKVPAQMCETLYTIGMVEDIRQRGKTVVTDDDEVLMKSRWVRNLLELELRAAQNAASHF
jgi:hypothetical protein